MADDKTKKRPQEPQAKSHHEDTKSLLVRQIRSDADQLRNAFKKVGNSADAIERELKRVA